MTLGDLDAAAGEVATTILLVGPGFVFLKALALSGGQHQRLQWEWVVWSVLASLPIAAATAWLLGLFNAPPPLLEAEPALRFVTAGVAGIAAGLVWSRARRSRWRWVRRIYRAVVDSAWDLALDDATRKTPDGQTYGVEVTVEEAGEQVVYYGTLSGFGYERAKAEPWVHLTFVQRWEGLEAGYVPLPVTEGLLVHRDRIQRLRIVRPPTADETKTDGGSPDGQVAKPASPQ